MKPLSLLRDAVRAKEIVTVLVRHRLHQTLELLPNLPSWLRRLLGPGGPDERPLEARLKAACEDLGPTFIKFAQLLSTRPDLLPASLVDQLKELRDQVRPVSFEKLRPILEAELRGSLDNWFVEFSEVAAASGSLAQVHRARLKATGEVVAVKIQRPGIRGAIEADLEIMAWFAKQIHEELEGFSGYDLPALVEEVGNALEEELDFTIEARNAELFNRLNVYPEIFAPAVFEDFTTRRLVVSQWVEGTPVGRQQIAPELGKQLAEAAGKSVFHQIILTGYFHADPHPGNLHLTADDRLALLDWGLTGNLSSGMRHFLADLLEAVTTRDAGLVTRIAMQHLEEHGRPNRKQLEREIALVLLRYPESNLGSRQFGRMLLDLLYVFGSHELPVMRDYSLLARALLSLEESGRLLDPNYDLAESARPFLEKLKWERWNPESILRATGATILDSLRTLTTLPSETRRLLRRVDAGEIGLQLHHHGLEKLTGVLEKGTRRLTLGLLSASLFIASALLAQTQGYPTLLGYPAPALVAAVLGGLLAIRVFFDPSSWRGLK